MKGSDILSFIHEDFTFNGVHSSTYGVKIVKLNTGLIGTPIAGSKALSEEYIGYRDKPFFYKADMQPMNFSITFSIIDVDSWSASTRKSVFEWLFSPRIYADFKTDDDYDDIGLVYDRLYKIIFVSPLEFQTTDLTNGYFTLTANSHPFAYTEVITQNESFSASPEQITINNPTNVRLYNNNFYYYPKLYINTAGPTTTFKMVNTSDSNREFELTGLEIGEELYVDNELKVINTDEPNTNRINDLTNKQWFRLVQGDNIINVYSYAGASLQIVSQFPVML